jgi:prolyl-tRNA synthetase
MMLRMSTLFVRTLREDPADAEVPSHRLLVRAGYVRRVAPGIYSWLPLGRMVLDNVARVVREEMASIGGQEVSFPALLPAEVYRESGRWTEYGADMFRLRDRRGGEYALGPTHEEMFTLLVRDLYASYRDFPVILYQVQNKYRDEARPRAGVLRGREFLMKDSYSFDLDDEGLAASYAAHRAAYQRIFERIGLTNVPVAAMSGAMGGTASEEFIAPSAAGEDTIVRCSTCEYAANVEAVETHRPPAGTAAHPAMRVVDTPGTPTIESLSAFLGVPADRILKNVVVSVRAPGGDAETAAETLVIGVPGDREVDLKRVEAALYPSTVTLLDDFGGHPGLVRGYIGPQILAGLGVRYLVDPRVAAGSAWVTGANEPDRHAVDVVCGRDFTPDGLIEAADVRAGDPCPRCGAPLRTERGIEIGHIFQLGRRFADVFGLDAQGPDGKPVRITMGSYGIGLTRAVASVAEQHHDERGLCWPASIAPCQVHVVAAGRGEQQEAAERLAGALAGQGLRVLLDDRAVSTGVKFADAELLGMPTVLVVGRRLADGLVELRDRATGTRTEIGLEELIENGVKSFHFDYSAQ